MLAVDIDRRHRQTNKRAIIRAAECRYCSVHRLGPRLLLSILILTALLAPPRWRCIFASKLIDPRRCSCSLSISYLIHFMIHFSFFSFSVFQNRRCDSCPESFSATLRKQYSLRCVTGYHLLLLLLLLLVVEQHCAVFPGSHFSFLVLRNRSVLLLLSIEFPFRRFGWCVCVLRHARRLRFVDDSSVFV